MSLYSKQDPRVYKLDTLTGYTSEEKNLILEFLKIEKYYRYALKTMNAIIENLDDYCENTFLHNPIHHIESRIKSPENIIEKMHRRGYEINMETLKKQIYDVSGMRVICHYINDIYQIISLLSKQKDIKVRLTKDYIISPKPTGYRSVHIVFDVSVYFGVEPIIVPVEIQFRTIAMDMWASLEHELRYKSNNDFTETDKKNLKQYSDDLYQVDLNMQKIYIKKTTGDIDDD
ncbi:MAG: (p)ppGpp synthetase [Acholeplasmatales bacterium]|nr:(p)ppGpp synthetase [Acholeplasmatales bacterium]